MLLQCRSLSPNPNPNPTRRSSRRARHSTILLRAQNDTIHLVPRLASRIATRHFGTICPRRHPLLPQAPQRRSMWLSASSRGGIPWNGHARVVGWQRRRGDRPMTETRRMIPLMKPSPRQGYGARMIQGVRRGREGASPRVVMLSQTMICCVPPWRCVAWVVRPEEGCCERTFTVQRFKALDITFRNLGRQPEIYHYSLV